MKTGRCSSRLFSAKYFGAHFSPFASRCFAKSRCLSSIADLASVAVSWSLRLMASVTLAHNLGYSVLSTDDIHNDDRLSLPARFVLLLFSFWWHGFGNSGRLIGVEKELAARLVTVSLLVKRLGEGGCYQPCSAGSTSGPTICQRSRQVHLSKIGLCQQSHCMCRRRSLSS